MLTFLIIGYALAATFALLYFATDDKLRDQEREHREHVARVERHNRALRSALGRRRPRPPIVAGRQLELVLNEKTETVEWGGAL